MSSSSDLCSNLYIQINYLKGSLRRCIFSAVNPDTFKGCRIIIAICEKTLLEVNNIINNQEKENEN